MASAQKRGFRLPWGDAPQDEDGDGATAAVADPAERRDATELDEAGGNDLGEGAFGMPDEPDAAFESRLAPIGAGNGDAVAPGDEVAATATTAPKSTNGARPGITAGWPDSDRRNESRAAAAPPPSPASRPAPPRRDNALVTGLLRAMREAASTARNETIAEFRTEVTARVEAVRTEGTEAAAGLRTTADEDIVGIREWGKAEMARIRQETETRIAERREQLTAETQAQAEATEAMLGVLGETVTEFESQMTAFFDRLAAETDPARLAGLAEQMPMPPSLEAFPELDVEAEAPKAAKPSRNGRRAEPEDVLEASDAESLKPHADAAPAPETAGDVSEDAHLDADAAAAAEAEAIAGLALPPVPTQSQLVVVGLATVPSIAAFKAELMRVNGVSGVNVTAGADGEFMFTVAHAPATDVRAAVEAMDRFTARVTADDGGTLSVAVEEPQS